MTPSPFDGTDVHLSGFAGQAVAAAVLVSLWPFYLLLECTPAFRRGVDALIREARRDQ